MTILKMNDRLTPVLLATGQWLTAWVYWVFTANTPFATLSLTTWQLFLLGFQLKKHLITLQQLLPQNARLQVYLFYWHQLHHLLSFAICRFSFAPCFNNSWPLAARRSFSIARRLKSSSSCSFTFGFV